LKQGSSTFVLFIKKHRVASREFLHEFTDTTIRSLTNKQVEMVRHEAVRGDFNERLSISFLGYSIQGLTLDFEDNWSVLIREIQKRKEA